MRKDYPAAQAWATDAYTIVNRIGYRHLQGVALVERGRATWALGDCQRAEADFSMAYELMAPMRLNFDLARLAILQAGLMHEQKRPEAREAWREAVGRITLGGFDFLLDQERHLALPLMAAYMNDGDHSLSAATVALLEGLQRVPPAPLKIATLRKFQVSTGKRLVDKSGLRKRKAGELLMLLALSPVHSLAADQAIEALWPEREPEAALSFLHQATSGLRRALESELPEKFPSR
jgi:tetratricopeptide (TPR) repeat protein